MLDPERSYLPLLEVGSAVVAACDSAVSNFQPRQEEGEIEAAMEELAEKTRDLARQVRVRLGGAGASEKASQCRTFIDRWEARSQTEVEKWSARRLPLQSLHQAL